MEERTHGSPDESGVRDTLERFHAALNAVFTGDVAPMQEVWSHADDVTYVGPDGGYRRGWAQVTADWAAQAALGLRGEVAPTEVSVVVGGEVALVHNIVRGANRGPDGTPVEVSLRATVVVRREAGAWKVIAVHTDPLPGLAG